MPFQKGQSGNPAGRPRGSRNRASVLVHSLLEAKAENLACKMIEIAEEGNIAEGGTFSYPHRLRCRRVAWAVELNLGCCRGGFETRPYTPDANQNLRKGDACVTLIRAAGKAKRGRGRQGAP